MVHGGLDARHGDEAPLQGDRLGHPALGGLEPLGQDRLVDLGGAGLVVAHRARRAGGLDHHHRHVTVGEDPPGDHHLEGAAVGLGIGGVRDPLAVGAVADAHGTDGTPEGDARHSQGGGRRVESQNVVGVLLVGAQHDADDVHVVAEAVGEGGTQGTVDETARQGRLLAGPALPAEERPRDLARGEHALLDVDGQREEVGALPSALGGRGGDEHLGPPEPGQHGASRKCGQPAGLQGHLLAVGPADRPGDADCLVHGIPFESITAAPNGARLLEPPHNGREAGGSRIVPA